MTDDLSSRIRQLPWAAITTALDGQGYAEVPGVLTAAECDWLVAGYASAALYRKTIVMERYRFGLGEYKYFAYPLPGLLAALRELVYPYLAPIANQWMRHLQQEPSYPASLAELHEQCRQRQQTQPTVLILRYGPGGHNTLHQDLYGEVFFPLQLVLFLSEPGQDYTGGEFVLTEQRPRAQSRATVLQPRKGDLLLFTTNFRPVRGSRGFYRATMKHGVSVVRTGQRHTLGIIFHDAR
ncbi:2OG-Fe(II) oxygenase [Hymenobacter terrenus]|uniref:2OG-Fe(II) oxygenase n=1 Tax=Hymenobacter terrenus TaxID=1629124 RepID=UPI000619448F|nr:2OG-Fe(II) oxygenase [Hymenobacter terrenus]